jgi:hypothetical protein
VETCEVTFDETIPCSVPVFESAGDQKIGESIFVEENEKDADWGDVEPTSPAAPVESVTTTSAHGPNPSLLLLGVRTSRLLSLSQLHLRRPKILLRGR